MDAWKTMGEWYITLVRWVRIHLINDISSTYEGQWVNNKSHGNGLLTHSNGDTYNG